MEELQILVKAIQRASLNEMEAYGINNAIKILEAKLTELEKLSNGKDN